MSFDLKILKVKKANIPVISIGNLTVGGTGKTPITITLAKHFRKNGWRVGILSRGYKRKTRGAIIVHDGNALLQSVENAGDEPFEMANHLINIPIVVAEKRIIGCEMLEKIGCNVILADDAFQHRQLYRDIDILLIDSSVPRQDYKLLPRGKLRESLSSLNRADFIVKTRMESAADFHLPTPENIPVFDAWQQHDIRLMNPKTGHVLEKIPQREVVAFCGLGNPKPFFMQVRTIFGDNTKTISFCDHVQYSHTKIRYLDDAKILITTEKDFWKLPQTFQTKDNLFVSRLTIQLPQLLLSKLLSSVSQT